MNTILTLTDYYLPGFRAGGLIRAVSNLIELLGDEFVFNVLTRDRDMGSAEPYPDLSLGNWQRVGKANVRYLAPYELTFSNWRRILRGIDYDLIYINSFFAYQDIWLLLLRKLRHIPDRPVIVAPRGSLLLGNLSVKAYKKTPYVTLARWLRLYEGVTWQASNEIEAQSIRDQFGNDLRSGRSALRIAPELLSPPPDMAFPTPDKQPGAIRLVFISRISPEKNLHLALQLLNDFPDRVTFDIYGVIDDQSYWQECQTLISHLPANVQVEYKGSLHPAQVYETFSRYHLFILPTKGESFNFTILEALSAGCPVLISDRTPWRDLQEKGVGWVVPLDQRVAFRNRLHEVAAMDQTAFTRISQAACTYSRDYIRYNNQIDASRQLFQRSLQADIHR